MLKRKNMYLNLKNINFELGSQAFKCTSECTVANNLCVAPTAKCILYP